MRGKGAGAARKAAPVIMPRPHSSRINSSESWCYGLSLGFFFNRFRHFLRFDHAGGHFADGLGGEIGLLGLGGGRHTGVLGFINDGRGLHGGVGRLLSNLGSSLNVEGDLAGRLGR
jgi:hypothetical protein